MLFISTEWPSVCVHPLQFVEGEEFSLAHTSTYVTISPYACNQSFEKAKHLVTWVLMISICENKSIIDSGSRVALSRNSIAFYLPEKELTGKSCQYSLHQIRCHRWIRVSEVVYISQLWWIPRSPKAKWEFKRRWGIFSSIFTTLYLPVFLLILFQTKP